MSYAQFLEIQMERGSVPKPRGYSVAAGDSDGGPGPCTGPTPMCPEPLILHSQS